VLIVADTTVGLIECQVHAAIEQLISSEASAQVTILNFHVADLIFPYARELQCFIS